MNLGILYTVDFIGSIKACGKISITLWMKQIIKNIIFLQRRYSQLVHICSELYEVRSHILILHKLPGTDDQRIGENLYLQNFQNEIVYQPGIYISDREISNSGKQEDQI